AVLLFSAPGSGQTAPAPKQQSPIEADGAFLASQGAQQRFEFASKISDEAVLAMRQQRLSSIPFFSGSFAFEGRTFPYTVVGAKPQAGGTTQIPTQIIPVSMLFEGFADDNGEPVVLDPGPMVARIRNSPNFHAATYQTGFTQFGDAVQRAQFYGSMASDWHTLLGAPQTLKPVNIVVPRGMAKVFRNPASNVVYALVDSSFFISQLNTIVQMANLRPDALALVLTSNVLLAPEAEAKRCCVLGFHTAFDAGQQGATRMVQTLVWASWMDSGILGANLGDVTPLSHEIGEWMNDPFGSNAVPAWQHPLASLGCQSTLETADPLAALPNSSFPVTIDGFTFHPQTQVLLPWFTRQPTDAIDGAYSFPDQRLLTSPSQPCQTS
ncbi:MAG: hypothetical protein ACRD4I_05010, partial [Candidatus Angelobacter sp.]